VVKHAAREHDVEVPIRFREKAREVTEQELRLKAEILFEDKAAQIGL
jgi:hypothetical protein